MHFFSFLIQKKFPNKTVRQTLFEGPVTATKVLVYTLGLGVLVVAYSALIQLNNTLLVTVPARGGTITEGIIGSPRFINPILAQTDTDRALSTLIFAGLLKEYGDGSIVPELAERYSLSPDGRTYTFVLKKNIQFHNGSPLSSSDVAFTIEKLKNPLLNPSRAQLWQDVSITIVDEHTISFTLLSPNESFLKEFTVGILPSALWQEIPDETMNASVLNLSPIGAGAFIFKESTTDQNGVINSLILHRNKHYVLDTPLINEFRVIVFTNQKALAEALSNGTIMMTMNLLPQTLKEFPVSRSTTVVRIPNEKVLGVYRKTNEPTLANPSLLALLNRFIDKNAIVATVENGYGIPFMGTREETPPPSSLEEMQLALTRLGYDVSEGVLKKGGTPVALGIAVENDPLLIAAGRTLAGELATFGVITDIQVFDKGTFNDELSQGSFNLVLVADGKELPRIYEQALPLYTTAYLAAFNKNVYGVTQPVLRSLDLRYANSTLWHARVDRIWQIKKNMAPQ